MTAAPPRAPVVPLPRRPLSAAPHDRADPATQQHRRLRWSATMAVVRARASLVPAGDFVPETSSDPGALRRLGIWSLMVEGGSERLVWTTAGSGRRP